MNKTKAEEVIPEILTLLSNGHYISLASFSESYSVPKDTLRRRFKDVVDRFYEDDISYSESDKCWYANNPNFLDASPLHPEEAVILCGILRSKDHYGLNLSRRVHLMVNKYIKRGQLATLMPETIEDIRDMEGIFILLENSIRSKKKVILHYKKNGQDKTKKFLPLKIMAIEYYWYVVGQIDMDGEKEMRNFRLSRITQVEILEEFASDSEFRTLTQRIRKADRGMNAYYKPYEAVRKIQVMMPDWFEQHVQDIPYFTTWKRTGGFTQINGTCYMYYEIDSTDDEYRDVIPMIQKYMPEIIVRNTEKNQDLIYLMKERSEKYALLFNASTT